MIYSLKIITVSGCGYCNDYKLALKKANIKFAELVCENDPGFCNDLESYVGCNLYPISIIETDTGITVTICLTDDYQKINTSKQISDKSAIIYLHSINTMLDYIKKI